MRVLEEAVNPTLREMMGENAPSVDASQLHYGGHSQGGLVGSLVIAVEPDLKSAVLNGTGGWLAVTIVERKDVMDIAGVVKLFFGTREGLDKAHPIVQIAQMAAEVVDPQSYARRWAGSPEDPDGLNVLVINGNEDPTTPLNAVNHLLLTSRLPILDPAGWDPDVWGIFDIPRQFFPASSNTETYGGESVLHAAWLEPSGGHFTIYYNDFVRDLAVQLWTSSRDGAPRLTVE